MMQSRLDKQNIAEYLSLALLSGFFDPAYDENDFNERKNNSIQAVQEIQNDNRITGFSETSSWDFSSGTWNASNYSGNGFIIQYGKLDGQSFTTSQPVFPEDPDSISPDDIDSISINLEVTNPSSLISFFNFRANSSTVNVIVSSYINNGKRKYRIIKYSPNANAL